jgi:hypothetical protein
MKTINLFRAGEFLFGLDSTVISSVSFLEEKQDIVDAGSTFLHIASMFSQKALELSEDDRVVIVLAGGSANERPPLLVTQLLDECPETEQTEPLPGFFPEQARRCCPRVMAYGDEAVLLVDPEALYTIFSLEQQEDLLVSSSRIQALIREKQDRNETRGIVDEKSVPGDEVSPVRNHQDDIDDSCSQDATALTTDDGDPVRQIIAWIVDAYRERSGNVGFQASDIPSSLRKKAGLSDTLLKYLIKETMARCRKA